jgi:hypothetical protein
METTSTAWCICRPGWSRDMVAQKAGRISHPLSPGGGVVYKVLRSGKTPVGVRGMAIELGPRAAGQRHSPGSNQRRDEETLLWGRRKLSIA